MPAIGKSVFSRYAAIVLAGMYAQAVAAEPRRPEMWIDLASGEPHSQAAVAADLASVRVVYLGERHTLARHHAVQAQLVRELARRGRKLVLGLEQIEAGWEAELDKFSKGDIDFAQLAAAIDWKSQWRGYEEYREVLEAAQKAKATVVGLNAPSKVIRQVVRSGGVARLPEAMRDKLPTDMNLNDPPYETLLGWQMQVHLAATPDLLRPMIEAQMARDEQMASQIARHLGDRQTTVVVVCGSGHVAYGLGTPARVRRRVADVTERIVIMSDSGDVRLTEAEKRQSRPVEITHEQLRSLGRPLADYLHVVPEQTE